MTVTKTLEYINKPLTQEKLEMLKALDDREIVFDEDSPELTEEELARAYRPGALQDDERQDVHIYLSARAINKARSLGSSYTEILSRIVESTLSDNEMLKKYL